MPEAQAGPATPGEADITQVLAGYWTSGLLYRILCLPVIDPKEVSKGHLGDRQWHFFFLQSITKQITLRLRDQVKTISRALKSNLYNKRGNSVPTYFSICLEWMCHLLGIQHLPATGILETNKTSLSGKHSGQWEWRFPLTPTLRGDLRRPHSSQSSAILP